jgi:putative transposase
VTEKFEFIDAEYAACRESRSTYVPPIVKMCRWLEVSRSGFYEWRNAPESATARRRGELALVIRKSFDDSDETYGYRRVHADLAAWGVPCGPELVRSIMRELGLEPCQPKPWRFSLTEGDGQEHDIPDLVNRDFTAPAPGEKMVGDITYISTWQGWVYLATVIEAIRKPSSAGRSTIITGHRSSSGPSRWPHATIPSPIRLFSTPTAVVITRPCSLPGR